jgi:hypothetical protein
MLRIRRRRNGAPHISANIVYVKRVKLFPCKTYDMGGGGEGGGMPLARICKRWDGKSATVGTQQDWSPVQFHRS